MPIDILMPALSPTMEEGTLAKWHVKVGDTVKSGDVIAEIETDKATMEVEAVDEGTVQEILVPEGTEEVKVNAPIARLSGEGETATPAPKAEAPPQSAPPTAPPKVEHEKPAAPPVSSSPPGGGGAPSEAKRDGGGSATRIFASPLARRIAGQKGLDLATLKGSGPHGRIIKADVESAQPGQGKAPSPAPAGQPQAAAAPRQV
ncbi:MAG: biotin/lipoyl-containing protein, partial [Phenylobacterium sp.]